MRMCRSWTSNPARRLWPRNHTGRSHSGVPAGPCRSYGNTAESTRDCGDKVRFFNHKRAYGARYFPLIGLSATHNRNLDLDLQVIGSNEVFNCVQANTNVGYARDLFGHGSPARSVVSYAGSFGNTTIEKIDAAGIRGRLAEDLHRFDAISVRDRNSAHVVEVLTGRAPEIHLDPTLVYDFASEQRIPSARQVLDKYVVVYGYSGRFGAEENSAVRRYAERIEARVLAFGGLQASADEFIDDDPFALLAHFRDAAAVITDTFHGSIFSIINEVPFATIVRSSSGQGYGNEEKLSYLLETLGLGARAWAPGTDLGALLAGPIDFPAVRSIRAREQLRTLEYLARVLGPHA